MISLNYPYIGDMKIINPSLKDFEVARIMFGSNTKEQCKIVKKLREDIIKNKRVFIIEHCGVMSLITEENSHIDWFIPNDCVENI